MASLLRPTLDLLKQGTLPDDSDSAGSNTGSSFRQQVEGHASELKHQGLLQANVVQLALSKLKQLSRKYFHFKASMFQIIACQLPLSKFEFGLLLAIFFTS